MSMKYVEISRHFPLLYLMHLTYGRMLNSPKVVDLVLNTLLKEKIYLSQLVCFMSVNNWEDLKGIILHDFLYDQHSTVKLQIYS